MWKKLLNFDLEKQLAHMSPYVSSTHHNYALVPLDAFIDAVAVAKKIPRLESGSTLSFFAAVLSSEVVSHVVPILTGRAFALFPQRTTPLQYFNCLQTSGIPADMSRLSFGGAELDDSRSLESYDVEAASTLHLNLRLLGGGKKKKKKNYTTPKVIKHKHKKVKLAVLKYYKVDDQGKITRLRRECTNESCGAGVFMAAHHDRQYCGKCGLTFTFAAGDEK